eukprot:7509943-Pyramimonas_sp.AAC.1
MMVSRSSLSLVGVAADAGVFPARWRIHVSQARHAHHANVISRLAASLHRLARCAPPPLQRPKLTLQTRAADSRQHARPGTVRRSRHCSARKWRHGSCDGD